jgi:hypothetical protein
MSDWECERVARFNDRGRRSRWLAGRALAKALVRERFAEQGVVDIREGVIGEPILYRGGLPDPGIWLGIDVRTDTVAAVVGDRPVSISVGRAADDRVVRRNEIKAVARLVRGDKTLATSVAAAVKEAAVRAYRSDGPEAPSIPSVHIDDEYGVAIGDVQMRVLAVLAGSDGNVVAIVGRQLLHERRVVRVVFDGMLSIHGPDAPRAPGALERSRARARRLADARSRWGGRLKPA